MWNEDAWSAKLPFKGFEMRTQRSNNTYEGLKYISTWKYTFFVCVFLSSESMLPHAHKYSSCCFRKQCMLSHEALQHLVCRITLRLLRGESSLIVSWKDRDALPSIKCLSTWVSDAPYQGRDNLMHTALSFLNCWEKLTLIKLTLALHFLYWEYF